MEVEHQMQPNDHTCVHTCLAMITGLSVDDMIDRFGDHALGFDETATVLAEHGLFPHNTSSGPHRYPFVGWYLVACASKNLPGQAHQVLVYADGEGYTVYDPQEGREGKKFWSGDELLGGKMPEVETLYIDPSVLRKIEGKKTPRIYQ